MNLTVREAARLLDIPEKTLFRWITQRNIPTTLVNGQYRFNRAELLEWATANRVPVSPELFTEPDDVESPTMSAALSLGGVYRHIGGADKASALRHMVDAVDLPESVDRDFLYEILLAREALGTTAIGDGIAIPHVRSPIVMQVPECRIALCYLDQGVDFAALDNKPVEILFLIISPTVRAHLHMLSRLGRAMHDEVFRRAVLSRADSTELLAAAAALDTTPPGPPNQE